jgi:hypothetical protein
MALPLLAALGATLLGGCTGGTRCPALPDGLRYCLQESAAVTPFDTFQSIHVEGPGIDLRLIAALEVDRDGMRMVGLTPMGQRVLETVFDNHTLRTSIVGDEGGVDAGALLALVQLALWPAQAVRAGLPAAWQLDETDGLRRVLRDDGRTELDIARTGTASRWTAIDLSLPAAGLRVRVRDLEATTDGMAR